jgi:hypothetical protein
MESRGPKTSVTCDSQTNQAFVRRGCVGQAAANRPRAAKVEKT